VASQRQNQQNRSWFFKVVRMGESLTKAGFGGFSQGNGTGHSGKNFNKNLRTKLPKNIYTSKMYC